MVNDFKNFSVVEHHTEQGLDSCNSQNSASSGFLCVNPLFEDWGLVRSLKIVEWRIRFQNPKIKRLLKVEGKIICLEVSENALVSKVARFTYCCLTTVVKVTVH